ncbi:variant erythrocyte surface antigen-1 family protein [Babesia divergens]|uniref:Variant erythrocyte surface antigen-1 family protein n=1 Tax=Babesia divergens TaxID=32595 RepID=A0AAD9GHI4_BABDI|nr:variant erythrocyte surface antigen-1 family protein [Babesia divergens]
MAAAITASDLLRCPKNLKECIDWVLRATERDLKGQNDNIDNLKNALKAVLPSFDVNYNALTQLVQGLCLFMGYPSCLCKPKKSVEESLERISGELNEELNFYKCSSITNPKLNLNCLSCKSDVVCKCCVLDCISKVQKSSCKCVLGSTNNCSCSKDDATKRCCKDLLEKLKASLSLLNLKADMETLCKCTDDCCNDGVCNKGGSLSCKVCPNSNATSDYNLTGLGLLRPSPIRLAGKLNDFFGGKSSFEDPSGCSCKCGSGSPPNKSCCCLACPGNCSQACSDSCRKSSCAQASGTCPRKKFCQTINDFKVASDAGVMKCCNKGKSCHCHLSSGQGFSGCCTDKKKVKCMILRLVKFFCGLKFDTSSGKFFKSCCELLCVKKTCEFLWKFYGKRNLGECKDCKDPKKGVKCKGSSGGQCCNGDFSKCIDPKCCSGCNECREIKEAKKFYHELETLRFAGPCGQDLYRVLKDFLECCGRLHGSLQYVENKLKGLTCCQVQKNGSPCDCCSSVTSSSTGKCQGCKDLLKDSKLMSILLSEFSSSYSSASASWPDCKSKSGSCCSPSCPSSCSGSYQCPPQGCCENCPKRLCAKIFLGMLPALYFGLKIVFNRSKYDSEFPDWYQKKFYNILVPASVRDAPDLKKFLDAWGFGSVLNPSIQAMVLPGLLENLFSSESSGNFDKIYDLVSKNYFVPSQSHSNSKPPKTVREILLWLYGLRFTSGFSSLVSRCKSLCSPFGNSFNSDAFCYYLHVSCFLLPASFISVIQDSSSHVTTFFSEVESLDFSYPEDPFELLEMLCEYVRKIYIPFHFLSTQCGYPGPLGGWSHCYFGSQCKVEPLPSASTPGSPCCSTSGSNPGQGYLCTWSSSGYNPNPDVHGKHCAEGGGTCINASSGSTSTCISSSHNKPKIGGSAKVCVSCPHPLMRFLCDSDSLFKTPQDFLRLDFSQSPPAILEVSKDYFKMGFETQNLSSTAKSGHDLHRVIDVFCDDGFYPLTRLLEFCLYISLRPPETFLEILTFFRELWYSNFLKALAEYASGEPGRPSGQDLTKAVKDFYVSDNSHPTDPSKSHSANLFSLTNCDGPKGSNGSPVTCGRYLFYLYNVDGVFIPEFCAMYISWVCHLGLKLPSVFQDFHEEAQKKFSKCCLSSSPSPCQNIVSCPCVLPFLYKYGFAFMSPGNLSCMYGDGRSRHPTGQGQHQEGKDGCTKKSCQDFLEQLKKVLKPSDSVPLQNLLKAIEAFLWSIRFPFFFGFLYVWFFVLSYFCYVILIKLDTVHTGSHLHLPRSFKILPSTLFSDASSKLKDLSYFTL